MSFADVNAVMKALHATRQLQSRIFLLTAQLSRHERSRNAAAFEPPPLQSPRPVVGVQPSSLLLANVLNDVDTLLLSQWDGADASSKLQQDRKAGGGSAAPNTIAFDENEDQIIHLRGVVERLRAVHKLHPTEKGVSAVEPMLLSSVDGADLVSLLGLIYSVARIAEDNLSRRIAVHQSNLNSILKTHRLSVSDAQVSDEISYVNSLAAEDARILAVPYQTFNGPGARSLVHHMIATKCWLTSIDLSHCLLGDRCVGNDLLHPLSKLQHLVVLLLEGNALTDAVAPVLTDVLPGMKLLSKGGDRGHRHDDETQVLRFPKLRLINLEGNLLQESFVQQVYEAVRLYASEHITALHSFTRLADKPSSSGRLLTSQAVRHIHCEATCMHAAILARSLLCCHLDRGTSEPYDIFSGASFASVVAVALMLDIPYAKLWTFFSNVSSKVFVEYHYSYYAVSASRSIRRWWTGGDYYSSEGLREEITSLFGHDNATSTLQQLHALTGKHCILIANRSGSSSAVSPPVVAFRSWTTTNDASILADATGIANQSINVRLVDALMACCAAAHMFAPFVVSPLAAEGGSTEKAASRPVSCRDAVVGSMDAVVTELLSSIRGRATLESTLFTPTEPFAAQDLLDPAMHKKVSLKLKEEAEQRATTSFNSSAAWQDAQGALVMWGDVSLSVAASSMRRMAPHVDAAAAPTFSLRTVYSVKKSASIRKSAVRLDEPYLERTVEVLDDSLSVPVL